MNESVGPDWRASLVGALLLGLLITVLLGCDTSFPAPEEVQPTAGSPMIPAPTQKTRERPTSSDMSPSSAPPRRVTPSPATLMSPESQQPGSAASPSAVVSVVPTPLPQTPVTPLATSTLKASEAGVLTAQSPTPQPSPSLTTAPPGAMGRILIPSLGIESPVVEVSWRVTAIQGQAIGVWETVTGAAAHHRGTAPFGGQGNCVISGHSRAGDGGVFQGLWELKPGHAIWVVTAPGERHQYVVESCSRIPELSASLDQRRANAACMAPSEDARLTLITCWPDWAYTHRVVVVARLW